VKKNELGRWRNTNALDVPIHGPAVVMRKSVFVAPPHNFIDALLAEDMRETGLYYHLAAITYDAARF
jgi:hypothetical protein